MDKKKILEDGLLEQYLLGELDDKTLQMVEIAIAGDSDLRAHFDALEADFERIAFENAVDPPLSVRQGLETQVSEMNEEKHLRSLANSRPNTSFWFAASIAALMAFGAAWIYNQWRASEENLKTLETQTAALQERLSKLEENYEETNNRYQQINNPNVVPLVLVGNSKSPSSRATAYVNHQTKEVILNTKGLSALDEEHTYQMWADVAGEMINMGVLSNNRDYVLLRYIEDAESLNITIEPVGGNDHPTVENLISNVVL